MAPRQEVEIDLTELNHSELVLLANWCGLNMSRAVPREAILEALDTLTPNRGTGPFERERKNLNEWLRRWWSVVQMQVSKKVCPDCYRCREIQVLDCYSMNRVNIEGS